ncbi:serine/threonine-protein kinase 11-interacting protein isoform X2 [Homalodisca vitripennis]|uniref:serine/threonine-protein kinase 11-interacting protein isoform X2 n=1 Tax=Homalodisca vitripennis TaxID=197043 RepID=UPI001EEA87A2|nr:serine/threonine-protein kinase 11-interacting protein isoform X2 [Homalodisca vitripennis]
MDVEQINIVQISNFFKQCEADILEGKTKLSLTASLLQKINYTLQELEYDYISFTNSTSTPEEPVKFLQDLIHKAPKLTITQKVKRETWRVDLSRFSSLKYLELNKVPMHLVEGMQSLRSQLQVLICERCTDCLEDILGSADHVWDELRTAKLCYNDFVILCPFTNTPWLQYLDLSYNKIEDKLSLQTLKHLKYLNLSFNFLTSVPMLSEEVCRTLKILLINNNYVQDLAVLSVCDNLEVLDVSNNLLADHSAISPILFLPELRSLNLSDNPISYHPHHRFHTCSYLNRGVIADEFLLDGKPLNPLEQKEIGRRGETIRHVGISLPQELTCLPSRSNNNPATRSAVKKKVRDVVIEEGTSSSKPKVVVKPSEASMEHLQTKRQVEELRERFGEDHWLHSNAGSYVQDLMGLERTPVNNALSSTPFAQDFLTPSPKFVSALDKMESGSPSRLTSSASEDYVTAMTTQAIIERIPQFTETSASESSDQEQKQPLIVESEPEVDKNQEPLEDKESESDETNVTGELVSEEIPEERKSEDEDEPEDNDCQLWLVQKVTVEGESLEMFLTLKEREIREKCTKSGRTVTKWGLESVESCEKVNSNPPTVHITFNTIRKNCRERTYIMEFSDAQELLKKVRAFLEARSLSAMNQVAYRCMKCSSMFSIETQPTVLSTLAVVDNEISEKKPSTKCPTCGSTLVVEMEEAPLPSSDKENDSSQSLSLPVSDQEKESQPSTSREETESSLALLLPATADSSASATPLKHSPSECSIGSAASLEQRMEVEPQSEATKEGTPTLRKYDSDIEVISNPSQSSIEVLEVQARLQGNPARKRSSEERSTVAVPPQLNTVHEVQNMVNLTESSSSGSLTDSVCTAYENNPIPAKRVGMSDVPEESTPTPSSTYTSLLEGLIQSVTAKLTPRNSPSVDSTFAKVQYSYTDFSKVDHRIKLHLCQNTFKDDNEELSFFVRGNIVVRPRESFPGCLVVSTHAIYILQIVGPEFGENASEWFEQKVCHHCSDLSTIFMLPWQLGFGLRLGSLDYLVLLGDPVFSCNFIKFLKHNLDKGENIPQYTLVEEPSTQPERLLEQMITSSVPNNDGPVDSSVRYLALCSSASTAKDKEEVLKLSILPLLVTTTDLLLIQPQFSWLSPNAEPAKPVCAAHQKLANIIDVDVSGPELKIHYLIEAENQEEVWTLVFSSTDVVNTVLESIRGPWEQLFSVPLLSSEKH